MVPFPAVGDILAEEASAIRGQSMARKDGSKHVAETESFIKKLYLLIITSKLLLQSQIRCNVITGA